MTVVRLAAGDEQRVIEAAELFDHPPDERAVRNYLADDRNYLLLAYVDERPAGFIRATELRRLDTERRQMFLYEIEVAPKSRRRGMGTALIRGLERICREGGFLEMFVLTNRSNTAAMHLYQSTGAVAEAGDDQLLVCRFEP